MKDLFYIARAWAVLIAACVLVLHAASSNAVEPSDTIPMYSVFIDENSEPFYRFSFNHIPTSSHELYGNRGQLELNGQMKLFRFDSFAGGTVDIDGCGDIILFNGRVGADLPDQLFRFVLQSTWTRRCRNGINVQVTAEPGIYNDMKKWSMGALFIPAGFKIMKDYDDTITGFLGIDVRHDFDTQIIPSAGFKWAPFDPVRMEIGIPECKAAIFFPHVGIYGGVGWQNTSFRKERGSSGSSLVTLEDYRMFGGLMGWITDDIHVFCEAGKVMGREIKLGHDSSDPDDKIDIRDAQMIRIGIGGPF